MILINTTYSVDDPVADDFIQFVFAHLRHRMLRAGMTQMKLGRIRADGDRNAITGHMAHCYALQFVAPSQEVYDAFACGTLHDMTNDIVNRYGTGIAMFTTAIDLITAPDEH